MSFQDELDALKDDSTKSYQLNIVLDLDGTFYSVFQVDTDTGDVMGTGSGVPTANIGLLGKVNTNPINVDIRTVRTTIQTNAFELLDKDGSISAAIGNSSSSLLNITSKIYIGFIKGSGDPFDFGDYQQISEGQTKTINKQANVYKFTAEDVTGLMNKDIFTTSDRLDGSITDSATTITVLDASNLDTVGEGRIEDEYVSWTGISGDDLTGVVRGTKSSTAVAHEDGTELFENIDTGNVNPIDLMLDILKSPDNGTLKDGLNIAPSLIDSSAFTSIRDTFFSGELYQFDLNSVGNGLAFLEQELLKATNTRFIAKNGLISLVILDQLDLSATVPSQDERAIITNPSWNLNSDKLVNKIVVNYNYSPGLDQFTRTLEVSDASSIADFGEKDPLELNFKGVQAALSGASIAQDRADRLLARLSTPLARIDTRTHIDQMGLDIGDKVDVSHRYIPQQGGGLGANNLQLEVLSKAINFSDGTVRFKLQFTSYSGLRIAVIAPSPLISSVVSQSVITVPDGSCYEVGYVVVLHNPATDTTFSDPPNTITGISGNQLTFANPWTTALLTSYSIKFAEYDLQSGLQQGRYGSISPNSGFFADGSKAYEIIV